MARMDVSESCREVNVSSGKMPEWKQRAVSEAIAVLNEALAADPDAISRLFSMFVNVNEKLAAHPTIQVLIRGDVDRAPRDYYLRPLGLINGLFGTHDDGYGHIAAAVKSPTDHTILWFEWLGQAVRGQRHVTGE